MSSKDKWIRRFSVDATSKHKNGFTIYRITSYLFPLDSPEAGTIVSVWKRYSDVQRLHKHMQSLHSGLYLRGTFPVLPKWSFFKRFDKEVIQGRLEAIKSILDCIAEHRLLFTSTEFVHFLQTGYPEPEVSQPTGLINSIRCSLHLPIEETPPLEYQTSDDENSPEHSNRSKDVVDSKTVENVPDLSHIRIFEGSLIETKSKPLIKRPSNDSLLSLGSGSSDFYSDLEKDNSHTAYTTPRHKTNIPKSQLPDLINFDEPNTSRKYDRSESRLSVSSKSSFLSGINVKNLESNYIFEAAYQINLAAKCEGLGEYQKAFDSYKCGIEKMLIGVKSDPDTERQSLIKQKINKYLSHAENVYRSHLCDVGTSVKDKVSEPLFPNSIPDRVIRKPYEELSQYRVLAVLGSNIMLVLHKGNQTCYAMKVIQKIPNNLTEFDENYRSQTKTPILPSNVPYMVELHFYIETTNLIFLILTYAAGVKLFDYIKNYVKSSTFEPTRKFNLDNIFVDPREENGDDLENKVKSDKDISDKLKNYDISELVINSQKLLTKVDKVLNNVDDDCQISDKLESDDFRIMNPEIKTKLTSCRNLIPPSAICLWAAEILTAIEHLHRTGVYCSDLNPQNILLSEGGRVTLTYIFGYSDEFIYLSKIRNKSLYIAPELLNAVCLTSNAEFDFRICDFWSYGAILYELICGCPLSNYHTEFTSHTILVTPAGLDFEVTSLLNQLLTFDPSERLGSGQQGVEEIKNHPYFKHIDWAKVKSDWSNT